MVILETRVRRGLDSVRPYLDSYGGGVTLLGISAGTVRLRMDGSCQSCPSSAATLKGTIEQAIYDAAPEVSGIVVEESSSQPASSPLVQLEVSSKRSSGSFGREIACGFGRGAAPTFLTSPSAA